ncbi:hypothetical protein T484DRAFT_1911422, partial [Baffinella frigidus]
MSPVAGSAKKGKGGRVAGESLGDKDVGKLANFLKNASAGASLEFKGMSSDRRKSIHQRCDELGNLTHESEASGNRKILVV